MSKESLKGVDLKIQKFEWLHMAFKPHDAKANVPANRHLYHNERPVILAALMMAASASVSLIWTLEKFSFRTNDRTVSRTQFVTNSF